MTTPTTFSLSSILRYTLMIIAILIVCFVGLIIFLFKTPSGHGVIISTAEQQISNTVGGTTTIEKLEGELPGRISLRGLKIDEDNDPATTDLLTAQSIEISWDPLALLRGNIVINTLALKDVTINHVPTANEDTKKSSEPFALPDQLPAIRIEKIDLVNIKVGEDVMGQSAILNANGTIAMGGRKLAANFNAHSTDKSDQLSIVADIDLSAKTYIMDADINSSPSGLIAYLAKADGPVALSITGTQSGIETRTLVNGSVGNYGATEFTINAPIKSEAAIAINGSLTPGANFADLRGLLGDNIDLDLTIRPEDKGAIITVEKISALPGVLSGEIQWASNDDLLRSLSTALTLTPSSNFPSDLAAYIGKSAQFNASLDRQSTTSYALAIEANTDLGQFIISDATTDLAEEFSGHLDLTVPPSNQLPPQLVRGLTLVGPIEIDTASMAKTPGLVANFGNTSSANLKGQYQFTDEIFNADLSTQLAPAFLEALSETLAATEPLVINATVKGRADAFALSSNGALPTLTLNGTPLPASIINANFTGLPLTPNGTLTAKAVEGDGGLGVSIASKDDIIILNEISYLGTGFSLTGEASMKRPSDNDPSQLITVDLAYLGENGAYPVPGIAIAGDMTIKGTIGDNQTAPPLSDTPQPIPPLRLISNKLAIGDTSIKNLTATATGSLDDLKIFATLGDFSSAQAKIVQNLEVTSRIQQGETINATIYDLSALLLSQTDVSLRDPLTVSVGDNTLIDNLNVQWGEAGSITGTMQLDTKRWQASLDMDNVLVPTTDGSLNLNINLDTDNTVIASGDFSLGVAQALGDEQPAETTPPIQGTLDWDGKALRLNNKQPSRENALKFSLALPAQLKRGPALSVSTEGEMSGRVEYDGELSPLTAAIPGPAQSLEGTLNALITLAGTLTAPDINGKVNFADGAYTDETTGLSLIGLHAKADAFSTTAGSKITFDAGGRGAGQDGNDRLIVDGTIKLGSEDSIQTLITLEDLNVSASPVESLLTSGEIMIEGSLSKIKTTGTVAIDEMNVEIITPAQTGLVPIEVIAVTSQAQSSDVTDKPDQPSAAPDLSEASSLTYDLSIQADDRIFVRGRGLESEWETDLNIITDDDAPLVLGSIKLRRGTFDFAGRRFDVTQGDIAFDRLSANDPVILIEAQYTVTDTTTGDDIVAEVKASGRASNVSVALTSTPVRPSSDVMAFILFGKPSENLTAIESLQTAQALASLGGIGPFGGGGGVLGSLRQNTGLDLLNVDFDPEQGASSLTVGKYVADGLFVSATQDVAGKNASVRVEYEITDNITVESNIRQTGDQQISANWKKDF